MPQVPEAGRPPVTPAPPVPVREPSPPVPAPAPVAAGDRMGRMATPAAPPEPSSLIDKIMQLREEYREDQGGRRPDEAKPELLPTTLDPRRPGDVLAPVGNLAIFFLTHPRYMVRRVQKLLKRVPRVMQGAHGARGVARELRAAGSTQAAGQVLKRELARSGHAITAALHTPPAETLKRVVQNRKATKAAARAAVAGNKGVLAFYQAARTSGLGRWSSFSKALGQTIEKGGSVPVVAKEAAKTGGKLARTMVWTARIGRVAPLLNVPLAIFDVVGMVRVLRNPQATRREQVSKTGQAVLTSTAAGLAVASFLTPPPLNVALLAGAGVAGVLSTAWSIGTSEVALNFFGRLFGRKA